MSVTYRIKFSKGKQVQFISHLDLMRSMKRSFKRGKINLSYSEGYHPHPKLSFAWPLPVGMFSKDQCYMDVELEDQISEKSLIESVNPAMPKGIKLIKAVKINKSKSLMSMVNAAKYKLVIKPIDCGKDELSLSLKELFKKDKIDVLKIRKKKTKTVNIKPKIRELSIEKDDAGFIVIDIFCDAGSSSNLSPMLIWEAIKKYVNCNTQLISIQRTGLYKNKDGCLSEII